MSRIIKGLVVVGMTLLSVPAWAESTSSDLFTTLTSSEGTDYVCPSGATSVTSSCYKLPPGLSAVAQALSGSSSSASSTSNSSKRSIVVAISSGNVSCPISAFSMSSDSKSKLLDSSKCSTSTSTSPVAVCTSDTAVSATLLTCALPTKTSVNNPFQKISGKCPSGGTRAVTGGYDSKTGVLDATVTLTACKLKGGAQIDGTVVVQGTDVIGTNGSVSINDTKTINEKITLASGKSVTRQCTIARVGTYTSSSREFSGTITRSNCSLSGSIGMGGLIDFLADAGSISIEETEGASGGGDD